VVNKLVERVGDSESLLKHQTLLLQVKYGDRVSNLSWFEIRHL
jgi:hypothetical protein